MKNNCPGRKVLSSFSDQFSENKTDPSLSKAAVAHAFKVFVWRNVDPLQSKG